MSVVLLACVAAPSAGGLEIVAVTFNTGTTPGLPHDDPPDDGYGSEQAAISDEYYGDGLAWVAAVDATRDFFADLQPDVVAFQEIFDSEECATVPPEAREGFVCEGWTSGDPTVAQTVLGSGYQIACQLGKPDKCLAVRLAFGSIRGCDDPLCLDGLDGAEVPGCGGGSRVGRGVVDLVAGGSLTVVSLHGTSGFDPADADCRTAQFEQVFEDLDGEPGANGERNLVLGDLNTDPARALDIDPSAQRLADFVGGGADFQYVSDVGETAPPSYLDFLNIDHVMSDAFSGSCVVPGIEGEPPVYDGVYFDHKPIVCTLVPEPAGGAQVAAGLAGLLALVRLRRRRRASSGPA